jgi:CHAT domain
MFNSYTEFEIAIQARQGDNYPLAARSSAGERSGILRSPGDDPAFQQLLARLAKFDTDQRMIFQIGTDLFNALFAGDIGKLYSASRSMLLENQGIVVRLRIAPGTEEIAALPWEFMVDPDSGPLSLMDASIARYLPQPSPVPEFHTTLPLKVLLTAAQTPPASDIERELKLVQEALQGLGDKVHITVAPHLTANALRGFLREEFHIWHFVGHGGFDKTGKTAQLLLEDANSEADPVSAMELNILLNRSGLRLVVLNACNSGKLAVEPFRSIAPALIRAQIPAVVAQQFNVAAESTREFVSDFYRSLAAGLPIDACMSEGRKAVMNSDGLEQPSWGIPVLYTRMVSGRLFDLPEIIPAPPATVPTPLPANPSVPAENAQAAEQSRLMSQLYFKRRELRLLRTRATTYLRPQAHHAKLAEQLHNEIQELIKQIAF